jgi:hypothetical protein
MIYKQKPAVIFDTSLMRAVDQIVDKLVKPVEDEQLVRSLGLLNYLVEHKSAFISLPRCSGKSTYIDKLSNHFKFPLIIAKKTSHFSGRFCAGHTIVSSLDYVRNSAIFRGRNNYYPAILADEMHLMVVTDILAELVYYGAVDKNTIVLGLSTS